MFTERNCEHCGIVYNASNKELNRGNGRFCGLSCSSKNAKAKQKALQAPNVVCANCNTLFYKCASKQKNSKTGTYFCSRDCKDTGQRIGGVEAIMPPHYGSGNGRHDYRKKAFEAYAPECADCGWNIVDDLLEVHHIDRNRDNNKIENLRILCPTCHNFEHYITRSGKFRYRALSD